MESRLVVFDMYSKTECAYKLLEEIAELYHVWEKIHKIANGIEHTHNCVHCDFIDECINHKHLGEELYDVLQVCANLAYKVSEKLSFDGKPLNRSIDKVFMHGMLGGCAEVFHYVLHGTEPELVELGLECTVRDVFTIAKAYGVDMEKAIELGTEKNLRRGRR